MGANRMNIITEEIEDQIQTDIIGNLQRGQTKVAVSNIPIVLDAMYAAIPEKKRISYGRYTTIKTLAKKLFDEFETANIPLLDSGALIYENSGDFRSMGVGLGILSFYGLDDYQSVLPYFESAASLDNWEPREYAQGLFRKIVKQYHHEIKPYLLKLVHSADPNLRRFVSEMLRPVVENRWLNKDIDYSISILRYLFTEPHPYPRTSVGNNLSDIARRNPELVYQLVEELVAMDDKNSYWIAYRACRNLVKIDPIRVMNLLGVDEYKYKKSVHRRDDYT